MPNLSILNFADINYWAVLASAVISMAFGYVWYSNALFGKRCAELSGIAKAPLKSRTLTAVFITTLVTSYVLALLINTLAFFPDWKDGVLIGFAVWLGFFATSSLGMVLWEKKPLELYLLKNGHTLIKLIIMGAIIAGWR